MPYLKIQGQTSLSGKAAVSGAKNAALPLMTAALLTDNSVTLHNFPLLTDTRKLMEILQELGATAQILPAGDDSLSAGSPHQLTITMRNIASILAVHEAVNQMRASILILGPLLAREGKALVTLPGGDAIGARPIDLHLKGLQAMGADIEVADGKVHARAPQAGLHGAEIEFPTISVGATEHLMMTAALAKGETVLRNAALEPEITDLARLLQKMGVDISGIDSRELHIQGSGGAGLTAAQHQIIPDRIEAASFAIAAIATRGDVTLTHVDASIMTGVLDILRSGGAAVDIRDSEIRISGTPEQFTPQIIETHPYPGFPTDVQAQMMALLCLVTGRSEIHEMIFENRFMHAAQYQQMGADITISGAKAVIHGGSRLVGSDIAASDIRACLGLVIAALAAEGETILRHIYHLDRGYEAFEAKLKGLGAQIARVNP